MAGNAPAPPFELTLDLADSTQVTIGQEATVILTFDDIFVNGAKHVLNLGVVVGGIITANSVAASRLRSEAAGPCQASRLNAVFTSPANPFTPTARLPVPIEAKIVDDCGNSLQAGAATVVFSSGDPALALAGFPGGTRSGLWNRDRQHGCPAGRPRFGIGRGESTRFEQYHRTGTNHFDLRRQLGSGHGIDKRITGRATRRSAGASGSRSSPPVLRQRHTDQWRGSIHGAGWPERTIDR